MKLFTILLFGLHCVLSVYSDYYDITTVYRLNKEEYYADGEVITRYLNTCAVSVHPQTNALNLPFIKLNPQSDDEIQYPPSPNIPQLNVKFNLTWKAQTSTGNLQDLQSSNMMGSEYFSSFKYFDKMLSKVVLEEVAISSIKSEGMILDQTAMKNINRRQDPTFLFLQGDFEEGAIQLVVYTRHGSADINIYIDCLGQISVCQRSNCNRYFLKRNEKKQLSFFISLKSNLKIKDMVAKNVYEPSLSGRIEYDYSTYHRVSYQSCQYSNGKGTENVQVIQFPPAKGFSLEKNIVTPPIKLKTNTTLVIASARKSQSELRVFIKDLHTGYSLQLDATDVLTFNTTDSRKVVVTVVNVRFPQYWTDEKQISIQGDAYIYITHIWEGGNVESYLIDKSKTCAPSDVKDIYDVIFGDPEMNLTVTSCLNGGLLHQSGQTCTCPPGFKGESCDIACGRNMFGKQCSQTCTNTEEECKGMLLCTPSYGCSCAPGYHGDQCLQECAEGYYGANCSQPCGLCRGGCDKYTGECRECASPYLVWPLCKENNSHWKESPIVQDSTFTTITLSLDFNAHNIEPFSSRTEFYRLQYKETSEEEWMNCTFRPLQAEKTRHVVDKLSPGKEYSFRVFLADKSFRTNDPNLSKTITGKTKCIVSRIESNLNVTKVTKTTIALIWGTESERALNNECPFSSYNLEIDVLWKTIWDTRRIFNITGNKINVNNLEPGSTYNVKLIKNTVNGESVAVSEIIATTKSDTDRTMDVAGVKSKVSDQSIYLQWFKNPLFTVYYIKFKLKRRISCNQDAVNTFLEVISTENMNYTLTLEPYAQYELFVTIDESQTTSERNFTEVTEGAYPELSPQFQNQQFSISNESLHIYWTDPESSCKYMNGLFVKYSIQILDTYKRIIGSYDTTEKSLEITGLTPLTDYKVRISYANHVGVSPLYSEYKFKTRATSSLNVNELTAYKMNAHSIGLRWKISETNATVTAITVIVHSQSDTKSFNITNLSQIKCAAWPSYSYMCYTAAQLKPNTKYLVSLVVYSEEFPEGGNRKSIQAMTRETAPSPVSDIPLGNIANKNMTISWRIPFILNLFIYLFIHTYGRTQF